jgi:hypothetical protein
MEPIEDVILKETLKINSLKVEFLFKFKKKGV